MLLTMTVHCMQVLAVVASVSVEPRRGRPCSRSIRHRARASNMQTQARIDASAIAFLHNLWLAMLNRMRMDDIKTLGDSTGMLADL